MRARGVEMTDEKGEKAITFKEPKHVAQMTLITVVDVLVEKGIGKPDIGKKVKEALEKWE